MPLQLLQGSLQQFPLPLVVGEQRLETPEPFEDRL